MIWNMIQRPLRIGIMKRGFSNHSWQQWKLDVHNQTSDSIASKIGVTSPLILPWGFLTHSQVETLVQPDHDKNIHTHLKTEINNNKEDQEKLLEICGGSSELCRGVVEAYDFIAAKFKSRETQWSALDVTSTRMSAFFTDICSSYLAEGIEPQLELAPGEITGTLQGVWLEEGSVDKPNKFLGMYDAQEIKYHLLSGFFPTEFSATYGTEKMIGKSPRRIVACVLIESLEQFNLKFQEKATDEPLVLTKHYWVLETDYPQLPEEQLQWRVRNINDAILPEEGEKLPLNS